MTLREFMKAFHDCPEDRVLKIEIIQENVTSKKIDLILEGNERIEVKLSRLNGIEAQQENHENRIWALEQTVKSSLAEAGK